MLGNKHHSGGHSADRDVLRHESQGRGPGVDWEYNTHGTEIKGSLKLMREKAE